MVAMLVCADNPLGQKFTPGPDGGIDVFVPDGPTGRRVFQVKNFPTKFTHAELRQVKKSLAKVVKTARTEGWTITEWRLVTPRDPSPANRSQLDTVVRDHGITTWSWAGLTQLDMLAARHPDLVDYYLNSGLSRLTDQLADLTAILRDDQSARRDELLQPTDVGERIRTLQRAANNDPHYRYHFETSDHPPTQTDEPWLVAVAAEQHGPIWLHIKVYAKFVAAMEERPITTTLHVDTTGNPDLAQHFEQFLDYGTDLHLPPDSAVVVVDLPGNLGGEHEATEVHITTVAAGSSDTGVAEKLIVGARNAAGVVVAELEVQCTDRTSGIRGGIRSVWTDTSGLFTLELRTKDNPGDFTAHISNQWSVDGRLPADVVAALTFMNSFERGGSLGISPAHGPRRYTYTGPLAVDPDRDLQKTTRVVTAIDRVQQHCTDLLRMPRELTSQQLKQLFEAATLVQGQTTSASWDRFSFTVHDNDTTPTLSPGDRIDVAVTTPLTVDIAGTEHHLGLVASFLDATVDSVNGLSATLTPSNPEANATRVLATGDEHQVWLGPRSTPET